jgi:hypothetical protein
MDLYALASWSRDIPDDSADLASGVCRVVVFPEAQNRPAGPDEQFVMPAIAFSVAGNLGLPIGHIRFRWLVVLGAAMPVTAIDEDGHPRPCEDDIRTDWPGSLNSNRKIDAIPKSERMKDRPKLTLGPGVPAPVRSHCSLGSWRAGPGRWWKARGNGRHFRNRRGTAGARKIDGNSPILHRLGFKRLRRDPHRPPTIEQEARSVLHSTEHRGDAQNRIGQSNMGR